MPTPTKYTYDQDDFPSQKINPTNIHNEILASAIVTALDRIDTVGGTFSDGVLSGTYTVDIWFKDPLSTADKTLLDNDTSNPAGGLIAAHNNSADHLTSHVTPQTTTDNVMIDGYVGTSSTSTVTVRATTYTPQGTDAQRSISSTSANDTSAGTGARTVRITYLNAAGNGPFTETVTMNGATPVNTSNSNIALIERLEVLTVGSGGGNAGTIRIHTTTAGGGSIWGSIAASDNRTYWAHHYVPNNKTIYINSIIATASAVAGALTINVLNPLNTAVAQYNPIGTLRYGTTTNVLQFNAPIEIVGPAIVFLNSRPDSSSASTTFAGFGYIQF